MDFNNTTCCTKSRGIFVNRLFSGKFLCLMYKAIVMKRNFSKNANTIQCFPFDTPSSLQSLGHFWTVGFVLKYLPKWFPVQRQSCRQRSDFRRFCAFCTRLLCRRAWTSASHLFSSFSSQKRRLNTRWRIKTTSWINTVKALHQILVIFTWWKWYETNALFI